MPPPGASGKVAVPENTLLLETSGLWQVAQYSGLFIRPALLWKPMRSWQVLHASMSTMARRSVLAPSSPFMAALPATFMLVVTPLTVVLKVR